MKYLLFVSLACAVLLLGCLGQQPANLPPPAANSAAPAPAQQEQNGPHQSLVKALASAPAWNANYSLQSGSRSYEFYQFVQDGNLRTDIFFKAFGSRNYLLGSKTYNCMHASENWTCRELASGLFMDAETPNDLIYNALGTLEAKPSRYTVTPDAAMQIAGTTASCYILSGQGGTTRYCVSPEGVPLFLSYLPTDAPQPTLQLSAKRFSATASGADFKLPAEPSQVP